MIRVPASPYACLLLTLVTVIAVRAPAADAPSSDEWAPIAAALASDSADAATKLSAITATYPKWPDGFRTLAQFQIKHQQYEPALGNARQALKLAPADAVAATAAIQALTALGRTPEAYAVADQFTGNKDPQGWVNFYAANTALAAKDRAKAALYLSLAMARNPNAPAEFSFLDARISELLPDFERAEVSLQRAVVSRAQFWDAWYELGLVQAQLAEKKSDKASEYLQKSEASFLKVTVALEQDPAGWAALGSTQLKLAQVEIGAGDEINGKAKAREAISNLRKALQLKDDLRDAHLNLGEALVITDSFADAIPELTRARALGCNERALDFNLMLAYEKTGRSEEFAQAAKNIQAVSTGEKIITGMGLYHAGSLELAVQLLSSAVGDLAQDRERCGAVYRFIGHAQNELAERQRKRLADITDPEAKASAQAELDRLLDVACDSYHKGGDLGDFPAQHYYMGIQTNRSPRHGYEAGWQLLAWHNYLSASGWLTVIGNYGGTVTGGKGLHGMIDRHPIHVGVWGALVGIPFLIFLSGLFRRKRVVTTSLDRPARSITSSTSSPPSSPVSSSRKSQVRTPAPASKQRPAPAGGKAPVIKAKTEPKAETEPVRRSENDAVNRRKETEPAQNPLMPTRSKTAAELGENGALERRTPRPGEGSATKAGRPPRT